MATILSPGDLAIVQYNSSTTDSFTFVFARDIEAGTVVNFTDNGWLAAGGFRLGGPDEGTVTYTAPTAITAGTVVTLTGLNLDDAGDQIIAYQGTQASPTILYLVDLADGNNTVAGDATNDNTTALPPGLTLGVNAVAVGFDNAIYAGPIDGSPPQLFPLISNSANWIDGNGLPPSVRYFYEPHLDLDSNNSTSGGDDYRAEVTNDRTPVSISDTDSDIDDPDGGIITFAQITIRNPFPGDVLSVIGPLPFGIFATPFDPFTGTLSLFGFGSHSAYQTAIEQIGFSTDAPVGVTKSIAVWVFDDFWWSNEANAIFTVTSAAVPPHLDLDANNSDGGGTDYTATFTNGGLAIPVADTDVSITDPDSTTIQSARITIEINRQSGDALIAGALPLGITASSYNPFTGTITLSGAASRAAYQTALQQVVFDTTSISTADRIIRVTVNDGTLDSNVATTYMHVVLPPPNVPPLLDLDANNSTTTGANYLTVFTDGGPAVAVVDADVSIIDNDSPTLVSATVRLTNGEDLDNLTFNFPAPGSIIVFGSGTNQISFSGAASAAEYKTALQQIRFNNSDTNPSTETRIVDIVVNDGAGNSNTAQALIQVEVVNNSAPVLDLDADDSSGSFQNNFRNAFTENGAPVPIADVDTSIDDADSTTLLSATIKLANPETGDLLTVNGVLPVTITTAGYDPGTGVLTLTGTGTRADYAAALTQIRYSNTSDDPVAGDRVIEVVVSDGANDSNLAVAIISVTATNDAPVITVDPAAAYVENAAPVVLAPTAALSDVDDTELNGALVTITGGSFPGDGDILSVGGVTSNTLNGITFVWMPAQHALVFSGASSVANYQDLLRQVQFQSSSDNPTDFSHSPQRTLTWAVTDSASVTTATTTVNIVAVNDAPEETVAATAAYTENGSPVTISPAATASDVDSTDLIYGEVRIVAGGFDGDILTVNGLQSGTFLGIDFSYDAGLRRLLFNNPVAVADYQALMQAVGFGSTSENPTNFGANPTRTLGWGLSDGENFSASAQTTQITITALNDAPVNTVPGAQTVAEDSILPIVGVSVADVDSSALTTTLSVANGILNVTPGPGVSGTGTAIVTITGTAAQINAALVGLTYTGNLNFNGADTLTVATSDGTATDTDAIAITVNAVNDAPVLNLDADSSTTGGADYLTTFTDGGPAVAIVDTDVSVSDIDSPYLVSATVTLTNPQALDRLTFNGTAPGGIIVLGSGTSAITLTGAASAADYQAALLQIRFDNTGTNPSTETRIIDVVVNDGTVASNLAHAIVEVTQVNNSAPTLDLDGNNSTLPGTSYSTTFTENGTPVAIADTDTLIGDPDIGSIASATIRLTNPQIGDLLTATLPLPGGITASAYDPVTGTLTLSNVASFADYETALEAIRFSAAGDNPVAGTRIIQVVVNDGIHDSQPATSHITVVAVNDAPVNTVPGAQSVAEDAILPIAGVSVADIDSSALTTTLSVANGILNVTAGAGVSGNGSASVTIAGTAAQINAALAGLTYTGNLDFNGGDTLTVVTGDGTANDTDTIAITVNAVNDAPVNTVPGAQSVAEDATLPIAGVSVADIDSSALTTTLNVSSGILNVTAGTGAVVTDNGTAIVSIAGTAAQINAALAGLTYTGSPDFNGGDTLTVVTGDGTANDTDSIAITVNPVNDAPVNTVPGAQSIAEDATLPIAGVSVADIDSSALTTTLNVSSGILNVTAGAGVSGNGTASVTITGTAVQINAALAGLAYTGNPNFNGADTLTVATNDGAAIDTDTIAITVSPVNDAPINTVPAAQSVAEDTTLPIAGVSVADIDSSALTTTLNVSSGILNVTAGTGAGVTDNGTASVSIAGTAAQINAALAGLAYTGNLNFNGADTLTVVTGDGTDTDTDTIAITVNPVNDAPALNLDADSSTTGGVDYLTTFTGSSAVRIVDTDVLITDSDDIELTSATVTLTNPHANDSLTVDTPPLPGGITASVYDSVTGILTLTGTASLADYQAALRQIVFNTTNPSTETRIIDVVVNDGTVASNLAHAIVEVVVVNASAPTVDLDGNNSTLPGTSYRTTFTENGLLPVAIADTDTLVGDPDPLSTNIASATIRLTSPQIGDLLTATLPLPGGITASAYDPVTGTLTLSNSASFADYETALEAIGFSTAGDNPIAGTRLIQVVVNDGINNSQPATSFIKVVAVNDAPINTVPSAQSVAEDTILPIAGVSVADIDSSALTTTLSVANGILNVTAGAGVSGNGSASVTIAGTAAQINAALAGLTYTGNLDFNGGDTLTVVTGDGTATDTDTIAITVNAVNDAPVNTVPGAQSVAEDATLPIAGVSVADIDSSALTTTLNVSSGILNVTAAGGVTGNGSASVSIAGTAAEINAALAGLTYAGNLNFNGADTLTVVTNDGTATDTDTIAITVNPVNDAPVNTVPGPQSVAEDAILPIAGVSVADIDSSALTTTLSVANGILNVIPGAGVTGNGSASVSITGTAAEINAALVGLAYTGSPDFNGADTLTVATNDGAAIDTDTIAITVTALNDAPINTVPAAQSVAEDTILPIAGVSVADIDSSALTTTLNVSSGILNVTAGAGVTGNGSASVTITGTAAQINAALAGLAYTGNLNFNGFDTLTVVTGDGTATDTDTIAITVNPVNDAPVLNLDANSSTTGGVDYLTAFTDGGPAVAIVDTDVLITDSDDIELASATVTLTNPDTNDVLLFNGAPPAGIAASVYNPVTGILTLTGTASLAAYQAALQQITFANTGTNPSTETRIIDVVVNDGTVASNLAHAIVEVTQVNNSAPTLDLDGNDTTLPGTSYSTTFTENGPAVAIADTDTLIGDPDIGGAIASATITLTNPQTGDLLTATLPLPGGITASAYDPLTGTLTLFNVASFADYETALEAIRFSSPGDNPVAGTRIIQVVVNDGIHNSQPATSHITVVAANDAPALVVADATYQEGAAPVLLSPSADLTDADDTVLDFAAVEITGGSFPGDGDSLTVNGATSGTLTGITFTWDPTLHALVLTGASSVANYQALLQTVTFQSTSHNPTDFDTSPRRTLTWFVSDGTAVTTATTTLHIDAHDDPAVAEPDAVATTEDALIRARAVAGNLFNNNGFGPDSDPDDLDGGTFAVTAVSVGTVGEPITLPSGALLIVNADGTFNYDPNHMFDYLPAPVSGASNLTYVDTFSYAITGGDAATVTVTVHGVDSNDVLYDSAVDDTLAGGIGDDLYYVHNTGDLVIEATNGGTDIVGATVDYTLPDNSYIELLSMLGSGLTGRGSSGADTLHSTGGPNTLEGRDGDDVYYVNNSADVVTEVANGGHDTVAATVNYTLPDNSNIELLSMLGSGLTGTGSSGADTLHSSSGPNTLVGLGGDDLYYVNNAGDVVIEAANGGFDTVAATLDYTLPANVEALYMYGSGLTATGSNGADTLYSSGGPNTLVGLGGDDFYYVNNTGDVVTEATNGGYDTVMAYVSYTLSTNVEAMYTSGSGLTGTGNSSANTLITLGDNTLVGGGGNDTFEFFAFSANGATVADFDRSEGDVLVFSGFGTEAQGATFTQIGSTDQWQIHSGLDPTHNETITFSNHAAPNAGDFFFV